MTPTKAKALIGITAIAAGLGTYALLRKDKPEDQMNVPYALISGALVGFMVHDELKGKKD